MNRLQTELCRLYLSPDPQPEGQAPAGAGPGLVNASGQVRAMVMDVTQPVGWDGVAALWQGVQDDLDLPAPAIAVSGIDGYQVWFSMAQPIPVAQAHDFLELLRQRYLGAIAPRHIGMSPAADASAPGLARHARLVPALQVDSGHWSAFVAPGLAGMFATEPWLDLAPSPDAQANILSGFESIQSADFQRAQDRLQPASAPPVRDTASSPLPSPNDSAPKRFLLSVMNDPATELRLRIEAAKALLPYV
ncbi:MAG: hypothetical protein PHQ58_08465 [Rhodoferax sp.]|uniref:hypothetical protein n=1 Tax=Rhodoferax sp. TaxID=50421 RepID=UPI00260DDB42|nr:hypothetical protein [Rhodoferax sp.]MDD2880457.1 hypothetical protein [Rhodoferax sp.]